LSAVWHGNYPALGLMQRLSLEQAGGAVRVASARYDSEPAPGA
jgi:hypothetical protein